MTHVATDGESRRLVSSEPTPGPDGTPKPATGRRAWPWTLLVLLVVGGGGWYAWRQMSGASAKTAAAAPPARAVPVVVATARTGDLPIYIDGLGTATAYNTVVVHTRVDGELVKVAFTEGQPVHAGELLAELDARPFQVALEQGEGQLARDQALLQNVKLDLSRYEQAREAVPQQQVDTAAANVAQYEAATKVDQSLIDSAKLNITYTRITAPLDGVIGLRFVDQGNVVHASDANGLAVITQLEPIAVQFSIPQDDLPPVLHAMAAGELAALAFDRELRRELARGHLQAVDNQINAATGTVRLKAVFENKDRALYPNQFVNVRLLVDTRKNVVLIPAAAVQRSPKSTFAYVVKADSTVEIRPLTPGPTEQDTVAVEAGITAGEIVVTDGVDKLAAGTKVRSRDEAAATGDAAPKSKPKAAH